MLRLTQDDVGKMVIIGTPINPDQVIEVYPEQLAKVVAVHLLEHYDEEPGDADWAQVHIDPSTNYDFNAWFTRKEKVVLPPGAPGGRHSISTGFEHILRFAD